MLLLIAGWYPNTGWLWEKCPKQHHYLIDYFIVNLYKKLVQFQILDEIEKHDIVTKIQPVFGWQPALKSIT